MSKLAIEGDSQLVCRQLGGEYRVHKAELKAIHRDILREAAGLDHCTVMHLLRAGNAVADGLANAAMDSRNPELEVRTYADEPA